MIGDLWQDLRYGVRSLRKQLLLSTVVVVTLTLGIGFSTGIFTGLNSEFLRARVDKDFDSFVRVYAAYTRDPARPGAPGRATLENYVAFRDQAKSLRNLAAYCQFDTSLGQDDPVEVRALMVTPDFFSLYGLERPLMGRLLLPEDWAAANPVVVLSDRLWRNQFAADPQIVGKVVYFNGQPVTVVGVTPTFAGMVKNARAWLPYTLDGYLKLGDDLLRPGEATWLMVEGRLNPGFSRRDAAEELKLVANQQDRLYPGRKTTLTVTDGSEIQDPGIRNNVTWVVVVIMGAITFFVLIVCVNVTTLLLSRAAARRHEIAIRLALGAGQMRLIQMLLIETLLQAAVAGLASLYIADYLPDLLRRWLFSSRGDLLTWSTAPDWRAFVYLTLVTLLAGTLAGLLPALQSLKVNLSETLKGHHSALGRAGGRSRLHALLIGAQVALSFFLLWGIAISLRAYQKAAIFDPGFETQHVLFTGMWTARAGVTEQRSWNSFHRSFTERLGVIPGVESVAYSNRSPFSDRRTISVQIPGGEIRMVASNLVSPNYFTTVGIPIVDGRPLREDEPCWGGSECPAVVSQTLAHQFWPNENPLGKTLKIPPRKTFEIVGVARDVSTERLGGADDPMIYLPWDPNAYPFHAFVRFSGDGAMLKRAVTPIIREIAPGISPETETIQAIVDQYIDDLGRMVLLIVLVGAIAVGLAAIGIYGVVAFAVTQRTRELGVRISLGAGKQDIYGTIIRGNVWPIVLGLLIGLVFTVATISGAAQVFRGSPFTLTVQDPVIYAVTAILLAAVALAAMLVPARRATSVDPMEVLRCE